MADTENYKGQLLIASPKLRDPNFAQTVLLIVRHDHDGALGLVLNRPLEVTLAEACGDQEVDLYDAGETLIYAGGPCTGPLMVLYRGEGVAGLEDGRQIIAGVQFAVERADVERLLREPPAVIRFFAGYAGWTVGQLEGEMEEGSWLTLPASADVVFGDDDDTDWRRALTRSQLSRYIDPGRIPPDASVN